MATLQLEWPDEPRDRVSVGLIYAIPHIVIVAVLVAAALVCALVSWFAIVFTGRLPEGLAAFVRNVVRWWTRVEAYTLLMRDEYPPFSLGE